MLSHLTSKMQSVNKKVFTELVIKNRNKLYKIAYSYVKDEQEALDIVSESVYKAYTNLKSLNQEKYFLTWMTRIVINTAIDNIRKNSKTISADSEFLYNIPDSENIEKEIKIDLYKAVDSLEAEEKTYIILKFFENYTFKEMSQIMSLPESTIKSRVYKCLEKMRNYMKEEEDDR